MIQKIINKLKFKILLQNSNSDLQQEISFLLLHDHQNLKKYMNKDDIQILESFFDVSFEIFSDQLFQKIQEKITQINFDEQFDIFVDFIDSEQKNYNLKNLLKKINKDCFTTINTKDILFLKEKEVLEFFKMDNIQPLEFYHVTQDSTALSVYKNIKKEDEQYIINDLFQRKKVDICIIDKIQLMSSDELKRFYQNDSEYFMRIFNLSSQNKKLILKNNEDFEWLISILPENFLFKTQTIFDYQGGDKKQVLIKNLQNKRVNWNHPWNHLPFQMQNLLTSIDILKHFGVITKDLLKSDEYFDREKEIKSLLKEKEIHHIHVDYNFISDKILQDVIEDEDVFIKMMKNFKETSHFNLVLLHRYVQYLYDQKNQLLLMTKEENPFIKIENILNFKILSEEKVLENFHNKMLAYLSHSTESINIDLFNKLYNDIIENEEDCQSLNKNFKKINHEKVFSDHVREKDFFTENIDFIIDYMTTKLKDNDWKDINEEAWLKEIEKFKKIGLFLPFINNTEYVYHEDVYQLYAHIITIDKIKIDTVLLTLHNVHKNKLESAGLSQEIKKLLTEMNIDFFDKYSMPECPDLVYEACLDIKRKNNKLKESYILQMVEFGWFDVNKDMHDLNQFKNNIDRYIKNQREQIFKKEDINMSEGYPLNIGDKKFNGLLTEHFYAIFDGDFQEITKNIQEKRWLELTKNINIENFEKIIAPLVTHTIQGKEFFKHLIQDFRLSNKNHLLWNQMTNILNQINQDDRENVIDIIYKNSIDHIADCDWQEDSQGSTARDIGRYIQGKYNSQKISEDVCNKLNLSQISSFYIELLSKEDRQRVFQKISQEEALYKIVDVFRFSEIKHEFIENMTDNLCLKWYQENPTHFNRLLEEFVPLGNFIDIKNIDVLKDSIEKIKEFKFIQVLSPKTLERGLNILIEFYPDELMGYSILKSFNPNIMDKLNKKENMLNGVIKKNNLKRDLSPLEQNKLIQAWLKKETIEVYENINPFQKTFNSMSVDFLHESLCVKIEVKNNQKIKNQILEEFPLDVHYFIFTSKLKENLNFQMDLIGQTKDFFIDSIVDHLKILKGYQQYLEITKDYKNTFNIFNLNGFKYYDQDMNEMLLQHAPILYLKNNHIQEHEKIKRFNEVCCDLDLNDFYRSTKSKEIFNSSKKEILDIFINKIIDKKDYHLLNKLYVDLKQNALRFNFFGLLPEDSNNYEIMTKSLLDNYFIYNTLNKNSYHEKPLCNNRKI